MAMFAVDHEIGIERQHVANSGKARQIASFYRKGIEGVPEQLIQIEELTASLPAARRAGNDVTELDGVDVTRVWRVHSDDPAYGLTRLEVTARWDLPALTLLTLVTTVPGRSEP